MASRFFPGRADMYATAMHFAKHSAANALIDGWKTVELCQAYILLSIYSVPAKRWEEDRSWLYTGLAIRLVALLFHRSPCSSLSFQARNGLKSPFSNTVEESGDRATRTRDVKSYASLDDMFELGSLDCDSIWQTFDHQRRLVSGNLRVGKLETLT